MSSVTVVPQYPILLWVLWQLHNNTLYFCEFCNRSGTPQRLPWEICIQYPTLLWVLWLLYHNTLHFCAFCNTSGTLQRLPSGSVTDPIPYRDYPYPAEPILATFGWKKCNPVALVVIQYALVATQHAVVATQRHSAHPGAVLLLYYCCLSFLIVLGRFFFWQTLRTTNIKGHI